MKNASEDVEGPEERARALFVEAVRDDPDLGPSMAEALRALLDTPALDADRLLKLLGGEA